VWLFILTSSLGQKVFSSFTGKYLDISKGATQIEYLEEKADWKEKFYWGRIYKKIAKTESEKNKKEISSKNISQQKRDANSKKIEFMLFGVLNLGFSEFGAES